MTLFNEDVQIQYNYSGAGDYIFPFRIYEDEDIKVYHTSAAGVVSLLTLNSDYTVAFTIGIDGGTITMVTPVVTTGILQIKIDLPLTQETDYLNGGPLDAETLERDLDRLVKICQQLEYLYDVDPFTVTNWRGAWVTSVEYVVGDLVTQSDDLYVCIVVHTSGTWATDLAAAKWQIIFDASTIAGVPNGGTTGQVLAKQSNADGDFDWETAGSALPDNFITGMVVERLIAFPTGKFTVSEGSCKDDTNTIVMEITSEQTKYAQTAWSVGSGNGALDAGSIAANTLYDVWVIYRDDTGVTDIIISAEADAGPALPTNYTHQRWIGYVISTSGTSVRNFETTGQGSELVVSFKDRQLLSAGLAATSYTSVDTDGSILVPANRPDLGRNTNPVEVLFGATATVGITKIFLSGDGINAKTIFQAIHTNVAVGSVNELYYSEAAAPCFVPIYDAVYYKIDVNTIDLYVRAVKFTR